MDDDFKYPVIASAKGGFQHFARNADDITICSKRGWKNGFYNGLNIVDSWGNSFKVQGVKKVGYVGFLWGFNFVFGQKIRIKLNYQKVDRGLSIDEIKVKIFKALKSDRHFWNSGGTLDELITITKSSKSYKDVIKYLTDTFYNKKQKTAT